MSLSSSLSGPELRSPKPVRGPRLDYRAAVMEDGVGSSKLLGFSLVSPEISSGSDSSTVSPVLDSLAPQPEPFSGISLSVLGLETNLVSGVSPVHVEDALANSLAMVPTALGVKGQREIKRLDCSINYDKKGEQSYRRRGKGRGLFGVNEA